VGDVGTGRDRNVSVGQEVGDVGTGRDRNVSVGQEVGDVGTGICTHCLRCVPYRLAAASCIVMV
jgi:hypothetical protein